MTDFGKALYAMRKFFGLDILRQPTTEEQPKYDTTPISPDMEIWLLSYDLLTYTKLTKDFNEIFGTTKSIATITRHYKRVLDELID